MFIFLPHYQAATAVERCCCCYTMSGEVRMRLRRTNSTSRAEDIVTEDAKVVAVVL